MSRNMVTMFCQISLLPTLSKRNNPLLQRFMRLVYSTRNEAWIHIIIRRYAEEPGGKKYRLSRLQGTSGLRADSEKIVNLKTISKPSLKLSTDGQNFRIRTYTFFFTNQKSHAISFHEKRILTNIKMEYFCYF